MRMTRRSFSNTPHHLSKNGVTAFTLGFAAPPPRPETLPTAVWINPPSPPRMPPRRSVTPDNPRHGVIDGPYAIPQDRSIGLGESVESLP